MITTVAFAIGMALFTYVLLSYEDEEKRVRNWLDKVWVLASDLEPRIAQRINAALDGLLKATNHVLNVLYSQQLFSWEAYFSALCFSSAIAVAFFLYVELLKFNNWLGLAIVIALLLTPSIKNRAASLIILAALYLLLAFLSHRSLDGRDTMIGSLDGWEWVRYFAAAMFLASAVDFVAIEFGRVLLRRAGSSLQLRTRLLLLLLTAATPVAAVLATQYVMSDIESETIEMAAGLFYPFCLISLFLSLAYVLVFATALATRFFAAVLPRAVYSGIKFKVLENRKTSFAVAIALMSLQFPGIKQTLEPVVKLIAG